MKKSTLFLLLLVAVLALVIVFWEKKLPSTNQKEADAGKIFTSFPEKIIRIERTGPENVVIEKKKDDWSIKNPIDDPADNSSVDGFIEALKGAAASRPIDKNSPLEKLGLSPPKSQVLLTGGKGEKVLLELGGKPPIEPGVYFRAGEKTGIIGDYLLDTINKSIDDFRSRELAAPLKPEDVKSVAHIKDGQVVVSLESRNGGWFVAKPYEDEADENKAYFFIEDVVLWPIMAFDGEMKDPASAGLLLPKEKIEITTLEGAKITVSIGDVKEQEKKFCYAAVSNRKGVFTVSRNSVRILDKDPEELRSRSVFSPDLYAAGKVEITKSGKTILNNIKEKGWEIEGQKGRESEARAVVYSLNGLKAEQLLPAGQKGKLYAAIKSSSGNKKTEVYFYEDDDILYASREGRKMMFRISKDDGDILKAAISKLEEKKK
jgi:hypothetical protein